MFPRMINCRDFLLQAMTCSSNGANHPEEQQGKKESRISGTSLPFYTQIEG